MKKYVVVILTLLYANSTFADSFSDSLYMDIYKLHNETNLTIAKSAKIKDLRKAFAIEELIPNYNSTGFGLYYVYYNYTSNTTPVFLIKNEAFMNYIIFGYTILL